MVEIQLDPKGKCFVIYNYGPLPRKCRVYRAYYRCSTAMQAERTSLITQKGLMEDYANKEGSFIIAWYRDEGISGNKDIDKRLGLAQLLKDIRDGEHLLIVDSDRLFRVTSKLTGLHDQLRDRFIGTTVVNMGGDVNKKNRIMFEMRGVLGTQEREIVAERTTSNCNFRQRKGTFISKPPYGWDYIPRLHDAHGIPNRITSFDFDTLYRPNPIEQEVISRIRELRENDPIISYANITRDLNINFPLDSGKRWLHPKIKSIINNPRNNIKGAQLLPPVPKTSEEGITNYTLDDVVNYIRELKDEDPKIIVAEIIRRLTIKYHPNILGIPQWYPHRIKKILGDIDNDIPCS